MGAAGWRDHVVVCGWSATAQDLVAALSDEGRRTVVVVHDTEQSPAGNGVHFVRGDVTDVVDLDRAGIRQAEAAIICPASPSPEADMRSVLVVMALESVAPHVRTVVEVNDPDHVTHLRRARADEVLAASLPSQRPERPQRPVEHPGLVGIVTGLVDAADGSELYRVALPEDYLGLGVDQLTELLRSEHGATLVAISRDGGSYGNPGGSFRLERGDEAVVAARGTGTLTHLRTLGAAPSFPAQVRSRAAVPSSDA